MPSNKNPQNLFEIPLYQIQKIRDLNFGQIQQKLEVYPQSICRTQNIKVKNLINQNRQHTTKLKD